eukprot:TRINITY_DN9695_c0_g2_i10.p1 TRINITY_DN9695_c0_g2~~TRINITY_DN9695_c0_g2_i10.p1  ORF type:complete len:207 (-),score=13.17 TRINITY_DN9695_c0_g2_i10:95-715(-)
MNFSTDLPKGDPLVSYIVASAMKCSQSFSKESKFKEIPCYRMHAVILKNKDSQLLLNDGKGLILCHIRKAVSEEENSVRSKRSVGNVSDSVSSTKKLKCETSTDNPKAFAHTDKKADRNEVKVEGEQPHEKVIVKKSAKKFNLKKQCILLSTLEPSNTDCLQKSRKLIEEITKYERKNYQELYRKLMEVTCAVVFLFHIFTPHAFT